MLVDQPASIIDEPSFEDAWHESVNPGWVFRFWLRYWVYCTVGFALGVLLARLVRSDSFNALDLAPELLGFVVGLTIFMPLAIHSMQQLNVIMLMFDDEGVRLKLRSGLVLNADWGLVRKLKHRPKNGEVGIWFRGRFSRYGGFFSKGVGEALDRKFKQSRMGPAPPSLEDLVDSRLRANV